MQGMISLRDALNVIAAKDDSGNFIPFSGTLIDLNLREETGGHKISFTNAVLAGGPMGKKNGAKNANHFLNGTRNIMLPGNGRPTKFHIFLLIMLNGERVFV